MFSTFDFLTEQELEERERDVTHFLGPGTVPSNEMPDWALWGIRKEDSIHYGLDVYHKAKGGNWESWKKHLDRVKNIAVKNSLAVESSMDYVRLIKDEKEAAIIQYLTHSHTPTDVIILDEKMTNIIAEIMKDFSTKKPYAKRLKGLWPIKYFLC